ncbi:MAG TPA: pyridoxamine 5'-phosphate oxidase family protein [Polyangiaceae bacterium]|nr:pyridoxamine 5'-phosphate oxidase family protein [Polyangiaceae bacterium]
MTGPIIFQKLDLFINQFRAQILAMTTTELPFASERTRVRRVPQRGVYDRATIDAILDEALICHVGFASEAQPFVIPTIHVRIGDELFIHGSAASRMIEHGGGGAPLCVTVTLVDGLVFARSAFHHSMNYRSVVILGQARVIADVDEKSAALTALVNRFSPGRAERVRAPNAQELKATTLLAVPILEASAKVRTGGPIDDPEDLASPVWAGVVPLRLRVLPALVSEPCAAGEGVPSLGYPFSGQ